MEIVNIILTQWKESQEQTDSAKNITDDHIRRSRYLCKSEVFNEI